MENVVYLVEGRRLLEEKLLSQMVLHPVMTEPHQEAESPASHTIPLHTSLLQHFQVEKEQLAGKYSLQQQKFIFPNILRTLIPLIVNLFFVPGTHA